MVVLTIATIVSIKVITLSGSGPLTVNPTSLFVRERPIYCIKKTLTFDAPCYKATSVLRSRKAGFIVIA
jgi:hypothetical protein